MKSLLFALAIGFAGSPSAIFLMSPVAPPSCDAQGYYDGTKWVMECVSYGCLNDCVTTQLGDPVGELVPLSCVCPPQNTTHECQSLFWVKPDGTIVGGGCWSPGSTCQATKKCKDFAAPPTTPAPVPPWDACECN